MPRRQWWTVAITLVAVLSAACGTRLDDSAFGTDGSAVDFRNTGGDGFESDGGSGEFADGEGSQSGSGGNRGTTRGGGTASGGGTGGPAGGAAGDGGGSGAGEAGEAAGSGGGGEAGAGNTASDVGVTPQTITVGNISAVQGPLGPEPFTPPLHGARAFFQHLNENGGVNGRQVRFITCDDQENPDRNKECARKLVENDKVFAFVANSTDTYASGSYISGKGIPDIGFPIGNAYYKYPTLFAIYGSPGYPRDGKTWGHDGILQAQSGVFRWFKQERGIEKAAVMYYNIPISRTAGHFIKDGLEREGIDVVYEPNAGQGRDPANPNWDSEVVAMRQAGAEAVFHAIDIAGFQKLCQSVDKFQYELKAAVATVQGLGQLVEKFSSPCRDSVYGTAFSLPYSETSFPQIAELNRAMEKYDPDYPMHQWVVDGWMAAKVFTDAVSAQGANLTRKGVVDWLNSQTDGSYTADGLAAPVTLYWPKGGIDYSKPARDCITVMKWESGEGTFVRQTPDTFYCFTSGFYPYEPFDDGS